MMAVLVTGCEAFGLTISEAKTEIMCQKTTDGGSVSFNVTTADQGGAIGSNPDLSVEVTPRLQRACAYFRRYNMDVYDRPRVPLRLKVRLVEAGGVETML